MTTTGQLLTKVKDPVPQEERSGVVYKIKCDCGDAYIGKTKRTLNTRIKEHKAACRYAHMEKSAVAEHAWQDGHTIDWENVKIKLYGHDNPMPPDGLKLKRNTSMCSQ